MKKTIIAALIALSALSASAQVNTDRVMMIGKNALYFEDYVLAIQYFNQVISAKPYLAEPYYFRAMSKFMLDDFKGAEEDASECLLRNPYYTAAYQLRGAARQNQEKYQLAATDYQRSLEFFPEDRITLVNMGIVNVEMKHYEVAEKFFEVLLRRFPDYTPGYLTRAQLYLEQGDTIQAMTDLDKAIEIDPYTSQSFSARGLLYFQQKQYNKALADLDEAIRLDPYFTGNYINRGLVKYHLNDLRGAMADYDRVIETEENNLIARFNRGLLRAQVADNNRAISDFDKVLELDPDNTIAYLNRSMLKNEIGDKGGALSDLNMVLEAHPDFFNGYYMRSQLKRELNDLRGSENDYLLARAEEAKARRNATSNPKPFDKESGDEEVKATRDETDTNIEKFNLLVVAHEEDSQKSKYQRQSRGKVQNIHAPVELEPLFVLTYYERSVEVHRPVYYSEAMDKGNSQLGLNWILKVTNLEAPLNELQVQTHFRSIDNYSRRLEGDPRNEALFFGRGLDFMLVQDYENALKDMNRVLEINPEMTLARFARAVIRTKQMEYDRLQDDPMMMDRGSEIELTGKSELPGTLRLPEISTRSIDYEEILKDYEAIIRLNPDFIFAWYNRAEIFTLENDYRAAISDYTRAIELEPQFAEAYFNRGLSRLSIGETAAGLDDLRKAGELGIIQSYSIIKRMQ
ncbi:MAG TPA: tetratricopeptide repeat protein [Proteiniphilum sp.]|nr:tetratricopeptide repeat protein [Proteiniphilum sp.]HPD85842.1 tetratricopeptide repeat protein [Proteiniphilum sp.]HPJ50084.1 tetratricopeptide repeat protein [Proteiniphilum sp.]HPR19072.1 tetratricopeptide repeat protein [Proteiniphilum sp.]